jgi:hypothetical protein
MDYSFPKTAQSPFILFEKGVLDIRGRSISENSMRFYMPLIDILNEYIKKPYPITRANLSLEYTNSSSNRSLLTLFEILEKLYNNGNNVIINWNYIKGDLEMLELGEDIKSLVKVPFMLQELDSFD